MANMNFKLEDNDSTVHEEAEEGGINENRDSVEYESLLSLFVYPDREGDRDLRKCVAQLGGRDIMGFESGGEKMVFFPSVLQVLEYPSPQQLSRNLSKLNIPLIKPTQHKLSLLYTQINQSTPLPSIPATLISLSNAERLFRLYENIHSTKRESPNLVDSEYSLLISMATELPEDDDEIGESKQTIGRLFPQLYTSPDAACIKCVTMTKCKNLNGKCCQRPFYSPEQFFSHTLDGANERNNEEDKENANKTNVNNSQNYQNVHWGLSSENWRFYIKLVPQNRNDVCVRRNDVSSSSHDDGDDDDYEGGQELCVRQKILDDVKNRFMYPLKNSDSSAATSHTPHIQPCNSIANKNNTSSTCSSLNTTPSMPTPASLSPIESNTVWNSQSNTPNNLKTDALSSETTPPLFSADKLNLLIPALLQLSQDRLFAISLLQHEIFKSLLSALLLSSQQLMNGQIEGNYNQSDKLSNVERDENNLDSLMSKIRLKTREFKRRSHLFVQSRKRKLQYDQKMEVGDSTQESQNDLQTNSTIERKIDDAIDFSSDKMFKRQCGVESGVY